MVAPAVDIPKNELAAFCRQHQVTKLSLFGSVLRGDFSAASDVDVLVEFEPGAVPGLRLIDMQDQLSGIFGGRQVDLVTEKFLNRRIRAAVVRSALVVYEK